MYYGRLQSVMGRYDRDMGNANQRKQAEIILMRDDIIQSIRLEANMASEQIVSEDAHARNVLKDIVDDDMSLEWVTRELDMAVSELFDLLHPYTKEIIERPVMVTSNTLKEPEVYEMRLMVPMSMPQNSIRLIGKLAHAYVVCMVLMGFSELNNMSAIYQGQASKLEDLKRKIDATKNRRMTTVRRTMHY